MFKSPKQNILARSKRVKKKKRRFGSKGYGVNHTTYHLSGVRTAYPRRKIFYKKGSHTRNNSVNSSRSSKSRRKFRGSSRSSSYSKRSNRSTRYISAGRAMKKRYIRNVLPHVQNTNASDRKQIVEKFTNPGQL